MDEIINVYCSWCKREQPCCLTSPIEPDDKWEEVECPGCGENFMVVQKYGKWVNYDEWLEKQNASK
jgi:hypothetical protein